MYVHSCCCILFSCIVWFEITFQNDLNLHSKFGSKLGKEKEKDFSFLLSILACWPVAGQSSHLGLSLLSSTLAHPFDLLLALAISRASLPAAAQHGSRPRSHRTPHELPPSR